MVYQDEPPSYTSFEAYKDERMLDLPFEEASHKDESRVESLMHPMELNSNLTWDELMEMNQKSLDELRAYQESQITYDHEEESDDSAFDDPSSPLEAEYQWLRDHGLDIRKGRFVRVIVQDC